MGIILSIIICGARLIASGGDFDFFGCIDDTLGSPPTGCRGENRRLVTVRAQATEQHRSVFICTAGSITSVSDNCVVSTTDPSFLTCRTNEPAVFIACCEDESSAMDVIVENEWQEGLLDATIQASIDGEVISIDEGGDNNCEEMPPRTVVCDDLIAFQQVDIGFNF